MLPQAPYVNVILYLNYLRCRSAVSVNKDRELIIIGAKNMLNWPFPEVNFYYSWWLYYIPCSATATEFIFKDDNESFYGRL